MAGLKPGPTTEVNQFQAFGDLRCTRMILIIGLADDEHVKAVVPALQRRGASVTWIDLAELPTGGPLTAAFRSGASPNRDRSDPRSNDRPPRRDSRLDAAMRAPQPDLRLANADLRDYVSRETEDTWHGVLAINDCFWVPAPRWDELRALSKPLQLALAAELGFEFRRR